MDTPHESHGSTSDEDKASQKFQQLVSVLPRERGWMDRYMHQYQGFWYETYALEGLLILQQHFQAQPSEVFLASYLKSGTTWVKALMFTIMNRKCFQDVENPLLKANPHELVSHLEFYATQNPRDTRPTTSLSNTHIPYTSLPDSIKTSGCRIVYVFREPKDVLVSFWHFIKKIRQEDLPPISLAEAFEQFSRGVSPYGPYWDHILGYWKASEECPERILLLSYEELKQDPCFHVRRLAQFLGHPFSPEEEKDGLVSKIVQLCSFENLSNLEVNKTGTFFAKIKIENNSFFRKGKVGDSKSHLSEEMMLILDGITKEKFKDIKRLTTIDSMNVSPKEGTSS